jgi:hypothetical protein
MLDTGGWFGATADIPAFLSRLRSGSRLSWTAIYVQSGIRSLRVATTWLPHLAADRWRFRLSGTTPYVYLLRQDVIRASLFKTAASASSTALRQNPAPTAVSKGC